MALLYNLVRVRTATTGTGTVTLGAAIPGYLTFALGGVTDGQTVDYAINDGPNSEIGTGVYTSAGTTLSRSVTSSTNGGSAISLSGSAQVFITPRAQTLNDASIITTGTMATARLGSGSAVSTTALFGDQTYKTLATIAQSGSASDLSTGTVPTARLGSGSPGSTTALFGDQTYKTVTQTGRLISRQTFFATNSAITPPAGATSAIVRMQAAGGGSGGTSAGICAPGTGGPGGGGAYLEAYVATLSGNFNYTLGAAGAAGTAGNNAGGAGTASTLAMTGITTLSAPGGLGGGGCSSTGGQANIGTPGGVTAAPTINNTASDWGTKGGGGLVGVLGTSGVFSGTGASFRSAGITPLGASATASLYGGGGPSKATITNSTQVGIIGAVGMLEIEWYS